MLISFPWMVFNGSGKISIDSNQQNYKLYYQAVEMPVGTGDKIDKITKDTNKAIEDTSKDVTIKIVDGKLIATTITIKYDKTIANKAHLQAGKSMAIVGGIVVLAGICFIMHKKNKSLIIK